MKESHKKAWRTRWVRRMLEAGHDLTRQEVADQFNISPHTAKRYLKTAEGRMNGAGEGFSNRDIRVFRIRWLWEMVRAGHTFTIPDIESKFDTPKQTSIRYAKEAAEMSDDIRWGVPVAGDLNADKRAIGHAERSSYPIAEVK